MRNWQKQWFDLGVQNSAHVLANDLKPSFSFVITQNQRKTAHRFVFHSENVSFLFWGMVYSLQRRDWKRCENRLYPDDTSTVCSFAEIYIFTYVYIDAPVKITLQLNCLIIRAIHVQFDAYLRKDLIFNYRLLRCVSGLCLFTSAILKHTLKHFIYDDKM